MTELVKNETPQKEITFDDLNANGYGYLIGRFFFGKVDIGLIGSLIDDNVNLKKAAFEEAYRQTQKGETAGNYALAFGKGVAVSLIRTFTSTAFYGACLPTAIVTDAVGYGIKSLFKTKDTGRRWQAVNYTYHQFGKHDAISITPEQKARAAKYAPEI